MRRNGLLSNHNKSAAMLVWSRYSVANTRDLNVKPDEKLLKQSEYCEYFGVYVDSCLTWNKHITYITPRNHAKLKMLNRIAPFLSQRVLLNIYKQNILPILDYGFIIWDVRVKSNSRRLERLQNQAMRIILAASRRSCSQEMRNRLYLLSLDSRRRILKLQLAFKVVNNVHCPHKLVRYLIKRPDLHGRILKDLTLLNVSPFKTKMGHSTFNCDATQEWNGLQREIREINTLSKFKTYF